VGRTRLEGFRKKRALTGPPDPLRKAAFPIAVPDRGTPASPRDFKLLQTPITGLSFT
jgi:hypothetical protein